MKVRQFLILILVFSSIAIVNGQQEAMVRGRITDEQNDPVFGATVAIVELGKGTITNDSGLFVMRIPANLNLTVEISYLGTRKITDTIYAAPGKTIYLNRNLESSAEKIQEVYVESKFERAATLNRIDIQSLGKIPSPTGGIEAVLGTLGASIRSEFSSQYSVRGGNFDENLVYINGIEIHRPLLVKSGQQEGLSVINSNLVSSIQFSAGGFDAQYGDKMSSVLDIRYKRPVKFGGSVSGSLLGGSMHLEGATKDKRLTGIAGIRYKSNQYLLNNLQTKGDYKPSFFDFQSYFTFDITRKIEFSLLGNISRNNYIVVPTERLTEFGIYQQPLNFVIYYDGQEVDRFNTYLGAATIDFHPVENLSLKNTFSAFNTREKVTYDIQGEYWINLVDVEQQNDSALNVGIGTYLQHARNYLDARVFSLSHSGSFYDEMYNIKWGFAYQEEIIDDRIREWEMIDSAGYSIPYSGNEIPLNKTTRSKNNLSSTRITGYFQHTGNFIIGRSEYSLNTGIRANYWSYNSQLVVSPRVILSFSPFWAQRLNFHAAAGYYYQPPFYKELRDPEGTVYKDIKAQKSVHYLLGMDHTFTAWTRPFIFSAEVYYKHLWNLIPYKVNDVDIQYLPQYKARGYATGIEFKINGEFVKDAESWATLSVMQTKEDIYRDYYLLPDKTVVNPGYYRRPTDQLVNFGMFFQDYFPNNPDYKVNMSLMFASRLPYGIPDYTRPDRNVNMRPYRRVDIGLSKSLKNYNGFRHFEDVWVNFEIFNLFGLKNQASFQWVKTVQNNEGLPNLFGVPNYLTGRIFNVRLGAKF